MGRLSAICLWLTGSLLVLLALQVQAADDWEAKITIQSYPSTIDPGEKGTVRANITNTGTQDWPTDTFAIIRAVKDPKGNKALAETPFSGEKQLGMTTAGTSSDSPSFTIEGGLMRGVWVLEVFVQIEGKRIEGEDFCNVEVKSYYGATMDPRKYPNKSEKGTPLIFEFDATNSGNVIWNAKKVCLTCKVLSANGSSELSEGKRVFQKVHSSVVNKADVGLDDAYRFSLKLSSPRRVGIWKLEWQLYDLENKKPFGQKVVGMVDVSPD